MGLVPDVVLRGMLKDVGLHKKDYSIPLDFPPTLSLFSSLTPTFCLSASHPAVHEH